MLRHRLTKQEVLRLNHLRLLENIVAKTIGFDLVPVKPMCESDLRKDTFSVVLKPRKEEEKDDEPK